METVVLRFANIYGPRQDHNGEGGVVAIFCKRLLERRPLTVFGTGEQTRDYVCVTDAADAFLAASLCQIRGAGSRGPSVFNIGTGVETSVVRLVELLSSIANCKPEVAFAAARPGEAIRSVLDARLAASELKWRPKVALHDGLAETYAWVQTDLLESKQAPL
jgi:UDP-glucose 4-epimerase